MIVRVNDRNVSSARRAFQVCRVTGRAQYVADEARTFLLEQRINDVDENERSFRRFTHCHFATEVLLSRPHGGRAD
jgi:hypothetical protein